MPTGSMLIELNAHAVEKLTHLMEEFGETRPDDMIATAISVMAALKEFEREGVVTVINPNSDSDEPDDREVDLLFEKLRARVAA